MMAMNRRHGMADEVSGVEVGLLGLSRIQSKQLPPDVNRLVPPSNSTLRLSLLASDGEPERGEPCPVENLHLYEVLRAAGFRGALFDSLLEELWLYGVATISSWLRQGLIGVKARDHGFTVSPTWDELELWGRSSAVRDELAVSTLALAVERFTGHPQPCGGWDPSKGARLSTYFITLCLYAFRDIHRKDRSQRRQQHALTSDPLDMFKDCPAAGLGTEERVILRHMLRLILEHASPDTQAICALLATTNATHAEIGRKLGLSEKAVEGRVYRLRSIAKKLATDGVIEIPDDICPGLGRDRSAAGAE